MSFLAVIGLFAGVAYMGRNVMAAAVARVLDETQHQEKRAQRVSPTNPASRRAPEFAFDRYSNTSWAAEEAGGVPPELTAVFDPPLRLTYVVISPGASNEQKVFEQERRPISVQIIVVRADGKETSRTVGLEDLPDRRSFYVGADQVSEVTLRILESAGPDGAPVSVAGVQFAGRP